MYLRNRSISFPSGAQCSKGGLVVCSIVGGIALCAFRFLVMIPYARQHARTHTYLFETCVIDAIIVAGGRERLAKFFRFRPGHQANSGPRAPRRRVKHSVPTGHVVQTGNHKSTRIALDERRLFNETVQPAIAAIDQINLMIRIQLQSTPLYSFANKNEVLRSYARNNLLAMITLSNILRPTIRHRMRHS